MISDNYNFRLTTIMNRGSGLAIKHLLRNSLAAISSGLAGEWLGGIVGGAFGGFVGGGNSVHILEGQ